MEFWLLMRPQKEFVLYLLIVAGRPTLVDLVQENVMLSQARPRQEFVFNPTLCEPFLNGRQTGRLIARSRSDGLAVKPAAARLSISLGT